MVWWLQFFTVESDNIKGRGSKRFGEGVSPIKNIKLNPAMQDLNQRGYND